MVAVTVGLPFYNARGSLPLAIRSVFAQTFTDWELLLVDDGSTDGSLEIAHSVRDPRVRVFSDGVNRRLPARLNQITRLAKGDLVARLDADDMMHPVRLTRQVAALSRRPEAHFAATGFFTIGPGGALGVRGCGALPTTPRDVLRRGLIAHATLLARRAWLLANPYDEAFPRAEDRELFCRTLGTSRPIHLPEPLYFVTHGKETACELRNYKASCRDTRRVYLRHGPRFVSPAIVASLLAESLAKEATFRAFTAIGLQRVLIQRRLGPPLTATERMMAEGAREQILACAVPGLDDAPASEVARDARERIGRSRDPSGEVP